MELTKVIKYIQDEVEKLNKVDCEKVTSCFDEIKKYGHSYIVILNQHVISYNKENNMFSYMTTSALWMSSEKLEMMQQLMNIVKVANMMIMA